MQNGRIYSFDGFELDAANRQLRRGDTPLSLPAKAFDVLVALVENRGRLVSKDEIFAYVWHDQIVEESNLTVHVSQIRKALGENKNGQRFIETVPGYGYRFVSDVSNLEGEELAFETQTLSRVTIEKEITDAGISDGEKISALPTARASVRRRVAAWSLTAIGGFAVLLATAFGAFQYFGVNKASVPFEKIKLTRLTNSGKVNRAAVSPDGNYVAYVLGESEGNSLWIQQVGTAAGVCLLPPVKAQIWELTFTPDGLHIVYSLFGDGQTDPAFYRISSLGGIRENIPNVVASFIAFAPDGKRIAYAQSDSAAGQNYLVIADADGGNQHRIAQKDDPNTFEANARVVAWSPDGETIACLVNHFDADASYSSIIGINTRDGSEKPLSEQRWYNVFSIEWLRNANGLLISASDKVSGGNQIHYVSYPQGESRQITSDLSQYDNLSATADAESLIAIQSNTANSISVGEIGSDEGEYKEIVSETNILVPLVWTPGGEVIFRSNKDGVANLWSVDGGDGGRGRQLTTKAQVDARGMCMSPDGRYLVFVSWRNGRSNLWRVGASGENLTQLTDGEADLQPDCSPDNRWVVYQNGFNSNARLWKVPLEGGKPSQLTDVSARWHAISTDGRRIAYLFMADPKWRIGIMSSDGGPMLQRLDVPSSLKENLLRWSPDDRSLFYIGGAGSNTNIWSLPLDGSDARPLTNFTSYSIDRFAISADKKRLAISRSSTLSDVVLINSVR